MGLTDLALGLADFGGQRHQRLPGGRQHLQLGGDNPRGRWDGERPAAGRSDPCVRFEERLTVTDFRSPALQVYEGQKYKLTLSFPNDYPFRAPTVKVSRSAGR